MNRRSFFRKIIGAYVALQVKVPILPVVPEGFYRTASHISNIIMITTPFEQDDIFYKYIKDKQNKSKVESPDS